MADALEQPLLLSQDMADLRSLKKHEVFQTLKRDLAMVSKFFFFFFLRGIHVILSYFLFFPFFKAIQAAYIAKELVNNSHQQMKEKEGQCIAAVESFTLAEQRIKDLNTKLTEANRDKKSVEVALEGAERQAESQRLQLCQTEDQFTIAKKTDRGSKEKAGGSRGGCS